MCVPYLPRFTLTRTLAIGKGWSGLIEFLDALFTFPSTRGTQFGLRAGDRLNDKPSWSIVGVALAALGCVAS